MGLKRGYLRARAVAAGLGWASALLFSTPTAGADDGGFFYSRDVAQATEQLLQDEIDESNIPAALLALSYLPIAPRGCFASLNTGENRRMRQSADQADKAMEDAAESREAAGREYVKRVAGFSERKLQGGADYQKVVAGNPEFLRDLQAMSPFLACGAGLTQAASGGGKGSVQLPWAGRENKSAATRPSMKSIMGDQTQESAGIPISITGGGSGAAPSVIELTKELLPGTSIAPHLTLPGKPVGKSFIVGSGTTFGGQYDSGVGKEETTALDPKFKLREHGDDGAPQDFYCAIRMDYELGVRAWIGKKILVMNPATQKAVVCEIKDWGPHGKVNDRGQNKAIDLSPAAMTMLLPDGQKAHADKTSVPNLVFSFAPPDLPLRQVTSDACAKYGTPTAAAYGESSGSGNPYGSADTNSD